MSADPVILVFGKSGQVAQELAKLALRGDRKFVFVGRDACDLLRTDPGSFIHATRPIGVINAAAYTAVDQAEKEPDLAFRLNAHVVALMATACAGAGLPFVHISTDYVFDGLKATPYVEEDAKGPLGAYGASKLAGEQAVEAVGGAWTILRTAWVFSAFGSNFVKTMRRLALERTEMSVVADQFGRPTLAADIAHMAIVAIDKGLAGSAALGGVFHIAGADDAAWADVAEQVFDRVGKQPEAVQYFVESLPTCTRRRPDDRQILGLIRPSWNSRFAGLRGLGGKRWTFVFQLLTRQTRLSFRRKVFSRRSFDGKELKARGAQVAPVVRSWRSALNVGKIG